MTIPASVSTAPPWPSSTASHTLFWSWFGLINLMLPRHRPINSNNNTCAVFLLPCLRKLLRIDSFHLTTNLSTNIIDIFHTLHITVYMMRPVTYFPLSARSDDEKYDVRAMLQQYVTTRIMTPYWMRGSPWPTYARFSKWSSPSAEVTFTGLIFQDVQVHIFLIVN